MSAKEVKSLRRDLDSLRQSYKKLASTPKTRPQQPKTPKSALKPRVTKSKKKTRGDRTLGIEHRNFRHYMELSSAAPQLFQRPPPAILAPGGGEQLRYVTSRHAFRALVDVPASSQLAFAASPKAKNPLAYQLDAATLNFPSDPNNGRDYISNAIVGKSFEFSDVQPHDLNLNDGSNLETTEHFQFANGYMKVSITVPYNGTATVAMFESDQQQAWFNRFYLGHSDTDPEGVEAGSYGAKPTGAVTSTTILANASRVVVLPGNSTTHFYVGMTNMQPGDWFRYAQASTILDAGTVSTDVGGYPVGNLRSCLTQGQNLMLVFANGGTVNVVCEGVVHLHTSVSAQNVAVRTLSGFCEGLSGTHLKTTVCGGSIGMGETEESAASDYLVRSSKFVKPLNWVLGDALETLARDPHRLTESISQTTNVLGSHKKPGVINESEVMKDVDEVTEGVGTGVIAQAALKKAAPGTYAKIAGYAEDALSVVGDAIFDAGAMLL